MMDYAVLLHFDAKTEQKLQTTIDLLVASGINPMYRDLKMRPHLTISEFSMPDIDPILRLLASSAQKRKSFQIRLGSVGLFPIKPRVLFYAPIVNERLFTFHRFLNDLLKNHCDSFSPLYQEGNWVAHCTLALDLSLAQMKKGIDVLSKGFAPIDAQVTELTLITCCPYVEIASFPLI